MGVKGIGGIDAPTPAREWDLTSHGFLATFGVRRFPKGNEGKRVSSGYNRRRRLATRSSGKQQAERTAVRTAPIVCPEESPLVRPQAHTHCLDWGLTRRLRREWWGCRPERGSTFLSKRKKVPKESTRHGDCEGGPRRCAPWVSACGSPFGAVLGLGSLRLPAGKRLLLPILTAGLATSRASKRANYLPTFVRAPVLTFFHRQNGRAFFPPLPIAALLPRRRRWADSNGGAWDAPMRLRWFRSAGKQVCFFAVGAIHTPIAPLGRLQNGLDIFATKKASVVFYPR